MSDESIFDTVEFNERLFFPGGRVTAPDAHTVDFAVSVPGGRVHVRVHRSPEAKCRLLFFHGNGEVVADYDDVAPQFARVGAELWVCDYRGYGASEGLPTLRNLLSDAVAVTDEVDAPFVVMGRSLGSAAVAELVGRPETQSLLSGAVIESGAADLRGLIRRRGLPVPEVIAPDVLAVFDPLPKLKRAQVPLLIIHGGNDTIIDPREAQLTYDTAGSAQKTLCLLEGHGHNDVMRAPRYWQALGEFIAGLP